MTTWREMLNESLIEHGEGLADVVGNTMTDEQMDKDFDSSYGCAEGCPFTVWTTNRVYFPVVYDGAEWVGSAPRNPCEMRR